MKTYVIYGLLTKEPGRRGSKERYAYTNLVYNTDDGVSFDDIEYVLRNAGIKRVVPIDIRTGQKLDYVIGLDRERSGEGGVILNRIAFNKKLKNDLNNEIDWVNPQ